MSRLWIRISYMSHVFEPSPQGVFRVVTWGQELAGCYGKGFRRQRGFAEPERIAGDIEGMGEEQRESLRADECV